MENVNDIFAEFAACFTGTLAGDGQIVHPERLKRNDLDYSVASLKIVDEYLKHLHAHRPEQMGEDWVKAVLWGGAYGRRGDPPQRPARVQLGRLRRLHP